LFHELIAYSVADQVRPTFCHAELGPTGCLTRRNRTSDRPSWSAGRLVLLVPNDVVQDSVLITTVKEDMSELRKLVQECFISVNDNSAEHATKVCTCAQLYMWWAACSSALMNATMYHDTSDSKSKCVTSR